MLILGDVMYKGHTFLAVIPARGGSKGIPKKNIQLIEGKPLIQYTIEEALKSKYIDRIIVSTDNVEIAEISKKGGAQVPFLRPKHLATDDSKVIDTIIHVIEELNRIGCSYDYVVLLQPTSPLRKHWHIDEAIEKIVNENERGLVSVSEVKDHPILIRRMDEQGKLRNLLHMESTIRRQDLPKYYKVNGAIYINKIDEQLNHTTSLNDNKLPYIMDQIYDLDIDTPLDLEFFKWLVNRADAF